MHQSLKPAKSLTIHNPMYIALTHELSTDPPILNNPLYNTPHRFLSPPTTTTTTITIPVTSPPLLLIPLNPPHNKRRPRPSNQPNLIPRLRRRRPKSQITPPSKKQRPREGIPLKAVLEEPIRFDNHHARLFVPPLHLVDLGEGADNDNVAGIWCAQLTQPAFEPRVILVMA